MSNKGNDDKVMKPSTVSRLAMPEAVAIAGTEESRAGGASRPVKSKLIKVRDMLRSQDMLVPGSNLKPEMFDEYRRVKRPLLSNAFGKSASLVDKGNLIMVTSSLPGEGKSFNAINLALSIADEQDHTVLLIDGDVTKQGVSRIFGLSKYTGLIDVLEGGSYSLGDVLLRTDIPNLVVLPAGKQHQYVTELLSSNKMEELIGEITTRYPERVIILDSPPILPTPQTQVLASLVGQIMFVVECGETPQELVRASLEMLPEEKALSLLLNKTGRGHNQNDYYYGYYDPYVEGNEQR